MTVTIEMAGSELARVLTNALAHASNDEARPALAVVRFERLPGEPLRVIGCDSYSLSVEELPDVEMADEIVLGRSVPYAEATEVARFAKGVKYAPVTLAFDEVLTVTSGAAVTIRRLEEAEFPLYRKLMADVRADGAEAPDRFVLGAWNLAKFGKMRPPGWESVKKSGNPAVTFRPGTDGERKGVEFAMGLTIRGLVMPVRDVKSPWTQSEAK